MADFWLGFAACYLIGAVIEFRAVSRFARDRAHMFDYPFLELLVIAAAWPINSWAMGNRP
jgi:hypothetical protein